MPATIPAGHPLPSGLWPRVRARLRRLGKWECPVDREIDDDRMVGFDEVEERVETTRAGRRKTERTSRVSYLDSLSYYEPLADRGLALEFLHVFGGERLPSAHQVIGFYQSYGPLCVAVRHRQQPEGDPELLPAWALRLTEEARSRLRLADRLLQSEPLWWLREKARELDLTYQLYDALRTGTLSRLRALLGTVPEGMHLTEMRIERGEIRRYGLDSGDWEKKVGSVALVELPWEETAGQPHRVLSREECLGHAAQLLVQQLNWGEEHSRRKWARYVPLPTDTPSTRPLGELNPGALGVVPEQHFDNLLAAMYLQLGDIVQGEAVLKVCEGCRRLFFRGRSDQVYCTKHCGDAHRQRMRYRPAAEGSTSTKARTKKRKKRRAR